MRQRLAAFLQDENGAVTVDFVVLTAGVVAIAIVVMPFITPSIVGMLAYIAELLGAASTQLASDS